MALWLGSGRLKVFCPLRLLLVLGPKQSVQPPDLLAGMKDAPTVPALLSALAAVKQERRRARDITQPSVRKSAFTLYGRDPSMNVLSSDVVEINVACATGSKTGTKDPIL